MWQVLPNTSRVGLKNEGQISSWKFAVIFGRKNNNRAK